MTLTSDPIEVVRDRNPIPAGSLRGLADQRADELIARLRAGEIAAHPIRLDRRRGRYLAVTAIAVVAAAAAAAAYVLGTQTGTQRQVAPPALTAPSGGPAPAGTPVANAAQADALLPFDVVLPTDATPAYMNVYTFQDGRRQLEAYFDTPSAGVYGLEEEPTDQTVGDLQTLAKTWKAGSAQIVVVGGVHVLVLNTSAQSSSPQETDVGWIRGDGAGAVITWLQGPWIAGQPFTEHQALSVASDIIGQGG
jgi:hypothetical protein